MYVCDVQMPPPMAEELRLIVIQASPPAGYLPETGQRRMATAPPNSSIR